MVVSLHVAWSYLSLATPEGKIWNVHAMWARLLQILCNTELFRGSVPGQRGMLSSSQQEGAP